MENTNTRTAEQLKKAVCEAIDLHRDDIIRIGEQILHNPELGYKEVKTSAFVKKIFTEMGIPFTTGHAINGLKGWLRGKEGGPNVAVIGELDAVISPENPDADPETGASHACGHNAQIAAMVGAGIGLIVTDAMKELSGNVCLFATPAEEYIEIEYRNKLRAEGKISYLGGKQQLISEGAFDDIDMAMMMHSEVTGEKPRVVVGGDAIGFIGKAIRFIGKEAHAGGAPYLGVNALQAASCAITCINAQRETFRDQDSIRVHPIITKGGDLVNTVPADVRMESYVRGRSIDAMVDANRKVNRSIVGACYAVGAKHQIEDLVGYLPLKQNPVLTEIFKKNAVSEIGDDQVYSGLDFAGSTDMGDLGYVIPVIQPTVSGFTGAAHSKEFHIVNKELAYILPAKLMAMTVIDLLTNGGEKAKAVMDSHPRKTADDYRNLWEDALNGAPLEEPRP